jgi:hypothetical protein
MKILHRGGCGDREDSTALWKEPPIRLPPPAAPEIRSLDYGFHERTCV